jgi:hypothetical protein
MAATEIPLQSAELTPEMVVVLVVVMAMVVTLVATVVAQASQPLAEQLRKVTLVELAALAVVIKAVVAVLVALVETVRLLVLLVQALLFLVLHTHKAEQAVHLHLILMAQAKLRTLVTAAVEQTGTVMAALAALALFVFGIRAMHLA